MHSAVYAMVPVSVCLSFTSRCSIETAEWIELHGFRHGGYLWLILHGVTREFLYLPE